MSIDNSHFLIIKTSTNTALAAFMEANFPQQLRTLAAKRRLFTNNLKSQTEYLFNRKRFPNLKRHSRHSRRLN